MEAPSLNVLTIRKLAYRKGCTVERTATIKQRFYVQIWDAKGRVVDGARRCRIGRSRDDGGRYWD